MAVLSILIFGLLVSNVTPDEYLKSQFPVYGLAEIASKKPVRLKTTCVSQLKSLYNGFKKHETWALRKKLLYKKYWGFCLLLACYLPLSLELLDASGSPTNGFIWGNNYWLGTYSHCKWLKTKKPVFLSPSSSLEFPPFGIDFYISLFLQNSTLQTREHSGVEGVIHLGLCLPSACTPEELESLLSVWTNQRPLMVQDLYNFSMTLEKVRLVKPSFSWVFNPLTVVLAVILSSCLLLSIVGTIYDIYIWTPLTSRNAIESKFRNNSKPMEIMKTRNIQECSDLLSQDNNLNDCYELKIDNSQHKSMPVHIIKTSEINDIQEPKQGFLAKISLCFSTTSNVKIIFNSILPADELLIIHGLRFMGTIWLIWLYSDFYLKHYTDNRPQVQNHSEGFSEHLISNSTFSEDTFFFTGGFILAFKYFKNRRGSLKTDSTFSIKKKVNEFTIIILKKFMRMTPIYLVVLAMIIISTENIREASLFEMKDESDEKCQKYWWRNIFYINNLYKKEEMCMGWSWFLSTYMQFFLLGVFILILSTRFWKFTFTVAVAIILMSAIITGYLSYGNRYIPAMQSQLEFFQILHYSPWTRVGPYLIGMFTGYFVVQLKGELIVRKTTLITCWLVGSLCNLWAIFGLYSKNMSALSTALYIALSSTAWGFGLSWIVIACCTGNASAIRCILAYPGWISFSKHSYSAYLLSPLIINVILSNVETPLHLDFIQTVLYFFGHISITYLCAFLLSLFFEIPLTMIGRSATRQKQTQNELNRQA